MPAAAGGRTAAALAESPSGRPIGELKARRRGQAEVLLAARERCWPRPLGRGWPGAKLPIDEDGAAPWKRPLAPGATRCRLRVAYDGTQYSGWMRLAGQPLTVAGLLDSALSLAAGCDVFVQGASRTDAGVHARGQAAHFDLPGEAAAVRPADWRSRWEATANRMLPGDIRVRALGEAPRPGFHATFSAIGKTYSYRLHVGPQPPDPLGRLCRYEVAASWSLGGDIDRLREAAAVFEGRHDFALFRQRDSGRRSGADTVRTIRRIEVVDEGAGQCRIDVQLDGALYKMVRNVVGCIVYAALGRVPLEGVREALGSRRGELHEFPCFPAAGLCLERVHYAEEDDF